MQPSLQKDDSIQGSLACYSQQGAWPVWMVKVAVATQWSLSILSKASATTVEMF